MVRGEESELEIKVNGPGMSEKDAETLENLISRSEEEWFREKYSSLQLSAAEPNFVGLRYFLMTRGKECLLIFGPYSRLTFKMPICWACYRKINPDAQRKGPTRIEAGGSFQFRTD